MSFYFLQLIKRNFFFSNLTYLLFIYYDIFHPLRILKTPDEICHNWTHFSCLPSILYPSLNYLVGYYIFSLMSSPIKTKKIKDGAAASSFINHFSSVDFNISSVRTMNAVLVISFSKIFSRVKSLSK